KRVGVVACLLVGRAVVTRTVDGSAQAVPHALGAHVGDEKGVLAGVAAARAGDDGDAAVQCAHAESSLPLDPPPGRVAGVGVGEPEANAWWPGSRPSRGGPACRPGATWRTPCRWAVQTRSTPPARPR